MNKNYSHLFFISHHTIYSVRDRESGGDIVDKRREIKKEEKRVKK